MNKHATLGLAALALLLSAARHGAAQQPPTVSPAAPTGATMTLKQVIERAAKANPRILAAEAAAARAAAEHEGAKAQFRPLVIFGSGAAYTKGFPLSIEGSAPSIFRVSSSQALFDTNLRNAARQAEQMRYAAESSADDTRQQVLADTALTYLDLDRSRRSLDYVRNQAASLQSTVEIDQERLQSGLITPVELAQAQLALARAKSQQTALQNQIAMLDFQLHELAGIPQSQAIETVAAGVPALPPDLSLDGIIARTLERSAALESLRREVQAKEFQVKSEQGTRWPRVNLVGEYGLFSKYNNYDQYFQRFERNNLTIGVSIALPVYERERYNARLAAANAELAEARAKLQQARSDVERQVRLQWGAVEQQAAAREVARLELEVQRRSLDAVLARYDEGRASRLAVEQARAEESRAWINFFNAEFEAEKARLELLRLAGDLQSAF